MTVIYKIVSAKAWRDFQLLGVFSGSEVDVADGYIHFSTQEQLLGTLDKHYAGQTDLVILAIADQSLDPAQLKWEPARGGALFPHLYGDLKLADVLQAVPVPLLEDGRFALPPDLAAHA
ncbi:MAG: DUF952 domain-containing protein [Pseudomonadota bacterium]